MGIWVSVQERMWASVQHLRVEVYLVRTRVISTSVDVSSLKAFLNSANSTNSNAMINTNLAVTTVSSIGSNIGHVPSIGFWGVE